MKLNKVYKPIIIFLLLSGSLLAMIEFKLRWESARILNQDLTILSAYFWLSVAVFSSTLGYVVISWIFERWKEYRQLKNERVETELSALKSKIDPHFFFNTLNNLYGMAREKSEDTPDVILELSDIMRFVIYEGDKERVSIADEVEYLQKYINLHSIRYKNGTHLELVTEVDNQEDTIAPLLLVTLIENGVKHGLEVISENPYLKAHLSVTNGYLFFDVRNRFSNQDESSEGVGLNTLRRRLELIYPKKHIFTTQRTGDEFQARIELELK